VTRWPVRLPPPRPEMPARLRFFDPADWPDEGADDSVIVAAYAGSWMAMADVPAWWAAQPFVFRAERRWSQARLAWCEDNEVNFIDMLTEARAARRGLFDAGDEIARAAATPDEPWDGEADRDVD
jgi:hypothetical protein